MSYLPVDDIVLSYIKGLRAIERTTVNSTEIARALNLPLGQVDAIVIRMQAAGVRLLR